MMRAAVLVLATLVFCATVRGQSGSCSYSNPDNSSSPQCSYPAPYCLGGACFPCNAYLTDTDDMCSCPTGKGCLKDINQPTLSTCGVLPKYGLSCTSDDDCITNNYGGLSPTQLVCVSNKCRMCNPATQGSVFTCRSGVPRQGATLTCVSPGVWGTPTSTVTTGSQNTAQQGSTTSGSTSTASR